MKYFPKIMAVAISASVPLLSFAGQWQGPLNGIISDVIRSGYNTYAVSADTLAQQTTQLCAAPTKANQASTETAFQNNVLDWQQVQWLNFGPVTYFMRYYAFEYWPDKKGVTQRQLRALAQQDSSVMEAPKFWTSASIAVRGLTAIESLLYHPDFTPMKTKNHCHLLEKVTAHQFSSASDVAKQWQDSRAQDWIFAEEGAEFDAEQAALEQVLQQWIEHMSAVKDAKLETPIGYNGHENLKLAEFYRSHLSLPSIQANLMSYRKIYHAGQPSLYDIAQQQHPKLANQLEQALINNQKLALQLPDDYFQSSYSKAQRIEMATPLVKSISASQTYLAQLVTQLGFQIGFNSRDGD
ncbi:imelysin family protein [Marinomonas posidonica]|uniref:Peptidase M75, Imelysin n=1 Tax=Marinomonas posidonica (strain CECT 7376 / NCIMB 14433 / IVIA-Po-181) TaxID=491952 RepID=F6CXY3_MARPP|nr:imelysin family protein [Marinomonas posidonica]AEF54545.1 Peptidase M75, Imelysin [Marinomonas posidonica IVIA-Po-181]